MGVATNKARDERFRRGALVALRHAPGEFRLVSGSVVASSANSVLAFDEQVEDEQEALRLIRDLVSFGLASEHAGAPQRRAEPFSLRHANFSITGLGVQLVDENTEPVPGVWDERKKRQKP